MSDRYKIREVWKETNSHKEIDSCTKSMKSLRLTRRNMRGWHYQFPHFFWCCQQMGTYPIHLVRLLFVRSCTTGKMEAYTQYCNYSPIISTPSDKEKQIFISSFAAMNLLLDTDPIEQAIFSIPFHWGRVRADASPPFRFFPQYCAQPVGTNSTGYSHASNYSASSTYTCV